MCVRVWDVQNEFLPEFSDKLRDIDARWLYRYIGCQIFFICTLQLGYYCSLVATSTFFFI